MRVVRGFFCVWGGFNFMMETGIYLIKQSYEDKLK